MAAAGGRRTDTLRSFARDNASLIGIANSQADVLKESADYTNPSGNMSYASLEQEANGIPVFQGEIKAGFNKRGEIVRVINDLAPGLDYGSLSQDFGDAASSARAAAASINFELPAVSNSFKSDDSNKVTFGEGDFVTTAEKMYFPTEPGVAVPAWRVLMWTPADAYYVIVDAATGTVLWRKDITDDQTQSATYNVYAATDNLSKAMDSPAPGNPAPLGIDPTVGTPFQAVLGSRTSVTLIGNEGNLSFNNLGWITDGGNETIGNNVVAGLDRDTTNGVDATNGRAVGTSRVFNFSWTPSNVTSGVEGGDSPVPVGEPASGCSSIVQPHGFVDAQKGAVTNLFYLTNRYHDALYQVGFTEAARNFQSDNFTRGGVGGDPVSAEAQDCSGTNNANFSTPADGTAMGRMQMYLFSNGTAPRRDGSLDANVVLHELTHGVSNRLIGNSSGLLSQQSGGMGEGWSDLYAFLLLTRPTDTATGVYTTGGYVTYKLGNNNGYTSNYYYGIRRFPYAAKSVTGGPNNRPHNPLTFADIDSAQVACSDGAFSASPVIGCAPATEVHNEGELWAVTGVEVWSRFVTRLGHDAGTLHTLQLYTDGMKLSPLNPSFLQERDALLAAAQAGGNPADVDDIWSAFAARGMGFSAQNPSGNTVVEAFDLPNLVLNGNVTVNDSTGNNNGVADPGELITVNFPFVNNTGKTASNISFQLVGGGSANLASLANGFGATAQLQIVVPANTQCGSSLSLTVNVTSSLGPTSVTRSIIIGTPTQTAAENFDGVTAPALPASWTSTSVLNGLNWATVTTSNDTAPNSVFAADSAVAATEADLTSASFNITAPAATMTFRHSYNTEDGWDGGVLEISIAGGAYSDILTAGGSFIAGGYNGVMTAATSDATYTANPLNGRKGWTGNSSGFVTTTVMLPAAAAGQSVQFKWRMGSDDNTAGPGANPGWFIDSVKVNGAYSCGTVAPPTAKAPFDFDGDNKTDIGITRINGGATEWWISKSGDSQVFATVFGSSTDIPVPGDYTGDGKADVAFWRPSTGEWFILSSQTLGYFAFPFGQNGDIPMPADYDGDGKMDAAVFRPSIGTWFILPSGGGPVIFAHFGTNGDKPVAADYDGDGKADIAIVRDNGGNKEWWIQRSTAGLFAATFGVPGDKTVPGDYNGDGKTDMAVWRPSDGFWYILTSGDLSFFGFPFGTNGDIPAPGDYDGDGKFDAAVFRPSQTTWFVNRTGGQGTLIAGFGSAGDNPVSNSFVR
jgi:hypothetical protein